MTTAAEHIALAEAGLEQAQRQEREFAEFCFGITERDMADPETLAMVQLHAVPIMISLAAAQVHATLAVAKR